MTNKTKTKKNRLYNIWYGMYYRCYNEKHKNYASYGGRGIKIEFKDFNSFVDWALKNGYNDSLTIDRINNDGNYSEENCRWVTYKEQENNRSNNTVIEYKGLKHTVAEWAEIYGVDYELLISRLSKCKMSLEEAINLPCKKRERMITYKGKTQNLKAWSKELGIPYYCLRSRLNCLHWTVEKAFETIYEGDKNGK